MSYALGIDTSNYKTSIALIDKLDNIVYDDRLYLRVNEGEKGLRQQEALFQHVNRLPRMVKNVFDTIRELGEDYIDIIAVSDKPRCVEGSYMPCFLAGVSIGKTLSASLNVPMVTFSHQQGHIEAGKRFTPLKDKKEYIAFHFSGGTTEALKCNMNSIEIIGGTKDISFGQLIDRVGVAMGYYFPSGEEIDYGAIRASSGDIIFNNGEATAYALPNEAEKLFKEIPKVKVQDPYINLSGLETWLLRHIETINTDEEKNRDMISLILLTEIGDTILKMMTVISDKEGMKDFLFVGGVSASSYLRSYIEQEGKRKGFNVCFSSPDLASDNAVGIAFLGGDSIWL